MSESLCPRFAVSGGAVAGGSAIITSDDLYDDYVFVMPLDLPLYIESEYTYLDHTTNEHHGINHGGVVDDGIFCLNSAYLDDTQGDYIELPVDNLNSLFGEISFSCWVRPELVMNRPVCFYSRLGSIVFGMDHRRKLDLIINCYETQNSYKEYFCCGATKLNWDTWYHVGFSFNRGIIKLYLNGAVDGTKTIIGKQIADTSALSSLGEFESGRLFRGNIQEARCSYSVRSDDWFSFEYNQIANFNDLITIS